MSKIRVMFVMLQLDAGGSERVVLDLARGLNPDHFEIYVASFNGGVLENPLREVCKEIFFIQKKKRFDTLSMLKISKIVREYSIDVVNAHHYMPCFYSFLGTRVLNRKKLFYTEHSVPEVEGITAGLHGKFLYLMLFRLNKVIGVSHEITQKFKEYYPRHSNKSTTIVNGVDIDKFNVKGARNKIRQCWGLTNEHFIIGTVANFRKVKNHACLVRAAARLKGTYPQLRLFLVGTGFPGDSENSECMVRELVHELGLQDRVIMAGYQEDIPGILSAFDMFCLPSFSEGLPVSILEAMGANVPVVGSHVRGINEVINNGATGLLFPSNDDTALSNMIEKLIMDPNLCKQITSNAYQYVSINHGMKNWIASYARLFQNDI